MLFLLLCCLPANLMAEIDGLSMFDVHSHYRQEDAQALPPAAVVDLLDAHRIERMVVIGEPAGQAQPLYEFAPDRFLPFLGLYRNFREKAWWMHDKTLPSRLEAQLAKGHYRGIGEIHLFSRDKTSPVFQQVLALADKHQLPVMIHGDAEVVEQAFTWFPGLIVIWAHLGTDPRPEPVSELLERYPEQLFVDTSVRDERFTDEQGQLKPAWRDFFIQYAEQVLVAIDTYRLARWQNLGPVTTRIRGWLAQLPPDVAERLAHGNARELFD